MHHRSVRTSHRQPFQCSSASRKFLNDAVLQAGDIKFTFQCSSASRKFLNAHLPRLFGLYVSKFQCSSASRKFLNLEACLFVRRNVVLFQCSSASRKFLNASTARPRRSSSAVSVLFSEPKIPQCRKPQRYSLRWRVSVLFSEPKIPQSNPSHAAPFAVEVSVLFSEPKIPQFRGEGAISPKAARFSALQRAENSSIQRTPGFARCAVRFQCSSASRKFLNARRFAESASVAHCFSALQRAENSSIRLVPFGSKQRSRLFQCSSASRKFLNAAVGQLRRPDPGVSVLFSEPKIPQ